MEATAINKKAQQKKGKEEGTFTCAHTDQSIFYHFHFVYGYPFYYGVCVLIHAIQSLYAGAERIYGIGQFY